MYTVRLENTVTHQIYEQQVEDTNDGGKLYFRFGISTIDLADGEYILTVFGENGDVLAEDLLRIGDFNPQTLQYTKGEKTYLDITVDAILQREKNVTITDIHTRILPDLGNDAVEIVYVDAQPLYDSARSEGYDEGYGVGQSEGYPNGFADGYNKGTEDGYNTGSAEAYPRGYEDGYGNGKTDGYNEGYDVGSMDMHLEMLEETRILNVTENGRYFTKYTEDPYIPTGDGDFSDFCKLTNTTYQMGRLKSYNEAQETGADVIEFWWRPKDLAYNHRPMILMSTAENDGNGIHHTFSINLLTYDREDKLRFHTDAGGWTSVEYIISSDPEMWYHISIQNSELYINDEFISKFYIVNDNETSYIYLNGDTRTDVEDGIDECNGYFGVVKINGEVFIPTENGYMDQNKGNIIQPIKDGEYEYLRQRDPEGGLYRTVNVNIDTKQYFLEGYDEGYSTGYNVGEQASFGNGYEQGQKDIAENARVLEVTENGTYVSKFTEMPKPDVVTGVYPDGTEFYNFAELTNIVYNTGIKLSENTKVEIWYKPRDLGFLNKGGIIGTTEDNSDNAFSLFTGVNNGFNVRIRFYEYSYNPNDLNKWFHIELSFAEGFVIDGVTYATYKNNTGNLGRYLFINDYDFSANGYFGMIKIDDTIIIPTEEGFLNTNTGTLLEVVEEGIYSFTNNTPKVPEGELYKTVNVNVAPKIDIAKEGITFAYSTIKELPKWADFSNATSLRYMFAVNTVMTEAPYIDTNKVTNWENCFWNMYQLKTAPNYDTENATKVRGMFSTCQNLETPPTYLNLLKCEDMQEMFYDVRLKDYSFLANWDINPKANMGSMITAYNYVEYIPAIPNEGATDYYQSGIIQSWSDFSKLTYFGGYIGRKYSLTSTSVLTKCPNLTRESCISILNNLYDFTGNGETPASSQGTLKVHQNFINNVGDDITIGTNKGWTITA